MPDRALKTGGFTLLEISVAIAVVLILVTLTLPIISSMRARAQLSQCTLNLRSLYIAADLFVQQNGSWPRVAQDANSSTEIYANAWVKMLEPFSAPRKTWICPTVQELMGNPDYATPDVARIDYFPMPFDDKPTTPHEWPRQPWFLESADVHGNGPLIIFTDGSVSDLRTVTASVRKR